MISQYVLLNSAENCLSTHIYMLPEKVCIIYVALATKYKTIKKSIHDICYSCMFRCCINGKGNLYPSVISKKTPTILVHLKIYCPTIELKKAKPTEEVY